MKNKHHYGIRANLKQIVPIISINPIISNFIETYQNIVSVSRDVTSDNVTPS